MVVLVDKCQGTEAENRSVQLGRFDRAGIVSDLQKRAGETPMRMVASNTHTTILAVLKRSWTTLVPIRKHSVVY